MIKKTLKKLLRNFLICLAILVAIWCLIHHRVIAAWIKGEPMPELPKFHKKFLAMLGIKIFDGVMKKTGCCCSEKCCSTN